MRHTWKRFQHVTVDQVSSASTQLICGVPRWSSLGPSLFSSYTVQVGKITEQCGIDRQLFADDTGLYGTFHRDQVAATMAVQNL